MKKSERLQRLIKVIQENATKMGISDWTLQNMITAALESNPGHGIKVLYGGSGNLVRKCKHFHRMPHHPLPNSISYTRKQARLDPVSGVFGTLRREDKGQSLSTNWRNVRANNYITYRLNQLGHLRDQNRNNRYWLLGMELMSNQVFQTMALNYVLSGWYKNLSTKEVNKVLAGVNQLVSEQRTEISLRRVYIPKSNGKVRPLGVPNKSWRVYLHMLNVLIVWFRTGTDKNQHAYFPGRGVSTAWESLMKRIGENNIYEFDLKSFFPSVDLEWNRRILCDVYGVPLEICSHLKKIQQSITILKDVDEMDESNDRHVLLTSEGKPSPNLPAPLREEVTELMKKLSKGRKQWVLSNTSCFSSILPSGWSVYKERGVPQGSAISCGLSTVSLEFIWRRLGETLLMYADDGLVFPKSSTEAPNVSDPRRGIDQNKGKSGWVKRNGVWEKNLKFLGLEYIPPSEGEEDGKLRAHTRNGSLKDFSLDQQLLVYLLNEKELLLWLTEEEEGEVEKPETISGEDYDVWIRRRVRSNAFLRESYGNHQYKCGKTESIISYSTNKKELEELKKEISMTVSKWFERASERFAKYPSPLSLLFRGKGLTIMAEMYQKGKPNPTPTKLVAKRGSWLYQNVGTILHNLRQHYSITNVQGLVEVSTKEFLNSRILQDAWDDLFCIEGRKVKSSYAGKEWLVPFRRDMKAFLKSLPLTMYNVSTLAVEDLLESQLKLERSGIKYCRVNKPQTEASLDVLEKLNNKRIRKVEKEFKQTYGVWPRHLQKVGET